MRYRYPLGIIKKKSHGEQAMNQQMIANLSVELIIKYYDNDYMPFLNAMDDDAMWYGPAEGQFLRGRENMIEAWNAEGPSATLCSAFMSLRIIPIITIL